MTSQPGPISRPAFRGLLLAIIVHGAALLWAYGPALRPLVRRWADDSRYTHGFLVPAFAAVLLWTRRSRLAGIGPRPSWWGTLLIALGAALRLAGTYIYLDWLEAISLLPCLAGLCVLLGGWDALRWAGPAIAFLAFMVPLPFRLELALGWPLQRIATIASTYLLQTVGLSALGEGNVIIMNEAQIGVVEACSGLSMLILFFALATGVAMLSRRPLLDRLLIVASAIPIALIANIARITITGVLHETVGERIANLVFHDLAGWLMMPMALVLLGLELWLLDWLFYEVEPKRLAPIALAAEAAPRQLPRGTTQDRRGAAKRPTRRRATRRM